jgi:crossover junction endodeoxyribonuclease RuvC
MTVLGLDLSLTSTGLALTTTSTITPKTRGYDRLRAIRERVLAIARSGSVGLVVVEGRFNGTSAGQHELGGLWWHVTEALDAAGYPLAVVAPTTLKKYATGKGNASKDAVLLAAARAFPWFEGGNDEADALFLRAMGCDATGTPIVDMPARNREALDAVQWPVSV